MAVWVTFMIGNGFDLNLGLKTRYENFLPLYVKNTKFVTDDYNILLFKNLLMEAPDYSRWADFELALGQHTTEYPLNQEDTLRVCLRDFKRCFAQYLREEEERIDFDACGRDMALRFLNSLRHHHDYLEPRFFNIVKKAYPLSDTRRYSILDFNYTTIIDRLYSYWEPGDLSLISMGPLIHVHGTHSTGMILGVDNIGQVANAGLFTDSRQERTFLKPLLNQQSGYGHDEDALSCIESSDIICIFGMSMGETDATWWKRIAQRMTASICHVVIFSRGKDLDPLFPEDILDYQDKIRDLFFSRAGIPQEWHASYRDRVHIAITSELFDLEPVLKIPPVGNPSPTAPAFT